MSKFDNVKVRQKVYSLTYGDGEVVAIDSARYYPIRAKFPNGMDRLFMLCGRLNENDVTPDLYLAKPEIIEKEPLPDLPVDEPVLVRTSERGGWVERHFSHFDDDGKMHCFNDGKTSWTARGCTLPWNHWKLPDSGGDV